MTTTDRRPGLAISLRLSGRTTLVVGAGPGAHERTSRLRDAGAEVRTVAPEQYRTDMCAGLFLIVAHSDDPAFDRVVAADASAAGALAYAHDQPAVSDFAFPALARRGPLAVAISTEGVAPALARRMREEIDRLFADLGDGLDRLLDQMASERAGAAPGPVRAERLYRLACRLRFAGRMTVDDG